MKLWKLLVVAGVIGSAVWFAPTAGASAKTIWHMTGLDPVASDIAGFSLQVNSSDNVAEWNQITGYTGPYEVAGFTAPFAAPGDALYDPFDGGLYSVYRIIWLSPRIYNILQSGTNDPTLVAEALLTLDHESMHQRLHSGDEGRVNACALQDIPRLLAVDFHIPATVTQTVSVPVTTRTRVRYRVRYHRRWVYRYRYVTTTSYVAQSQSVPNPTFTSIVAAATALYKSQPPPYSTGTCY